MPRKKKPDNEKYIRQDISVEPKQMERLLTYCRREDRTISWVIRQALTLFFKNNNV